MKKRQTAVVICPGRGTYTKTELGYLARHPGRKSGKAARIEHFIADTDARLLALSAPTVSALDGAAAFSLKTHTPGEFASTLIYACSAVDFLSIDQDQFEIVAVTGNSMGWYTALALAGALTEPNAFALIHTMGSMMSAGLIGGQLIYPLVDDNWRASSALDGQLERAIIATKQVQGCEVFPSIRFGGYAIVGGNEAGLAHLKSLLPATPDGKYPFVLVNHAAFHTPMMGGVSQRAMESLPLDLFQAPTLPLIDGRGAIWQPYSTDVAALREYTLGHQVCATYDFSAAVTAALKEFAPDRLILLGPGSTSGGAIGQILIASSWMGITGKTAFSDRQATDPYLLATGRPEQAALVMSP